MSKLRELEEIVDEVSNNTEEPQTKVYAVLAFDICSSTDILETLLRTGELNRWRRLLIRMKQFLKKNETPFSFTLYNFTGDGWIVLFQEPVDGVALLDFLESLCVFYQDEFEKVINPVLETLPSLTGITMGLDRGPLIKVRMNSRDEYIGRALNVACRLQSAIKQNDSHPEYKVLMSKSIYEHIKPKVGTKGFASVDRKLSNVAGNKNIQCIKKVIVRTEDNYQKSKKTV